MTRPATMLALLVDALFCVLIGFGAPLLVAVIGWLVTSGWTTVAWGDLVTIVSSLWALGLGGGVGVTISPQAFPALQLAQPFAFVVSLAPLAFTALIAWLGWRAGRRLDDEDAPWTGLAIAIGAFALAAWASLQFAGGQVFRIDVPGALITGTLVWAAAVLIGMRVWEHAPWEQWLGDRTDAVLGQAGPVLRTAGGLLAGSLGLGALLILVMTIAGLGRVVGLMQALQLDVWGVIAVSLVQLAYAPTLVVWAIAWMLGPGVMLGTGSLASPAGTDAAPLPVVPVLGLIPDGVAPVAFAIIALPLALAIAVTLLRRRMLSGSEDGHGLVDRLIAPIGGALVAAGVLALLAHLSRGALGPERLVDFGPVPGWVFLAALGVFAVGGAIAAFVPLEAVAGRFGAVEYSDDDLLAPEPAKVGTRAESTRGAAGGTKRGAAQSSSASDADTIDLSEVRAAKAARGDTGPASKRASTPASAPKKSPTPKNAPAGKPSPASEQPPTAKRTPFAGGAAATTPAPDDPRATPSADEPPATPPSTKRKPRKRNPSDRDLSEALRRPDEPDIYADLDDDL